MRRAFQILLTLGAAALVATAASAAVEPANRSTPSAWNWEIKDGKRVPKAERKVDADGTAREEVRRGNCVSVTEKLPDGTIKKSDHC